MLKVESDSFRYDLNLLENLGAFGRDPKSKIANLVSIIQSEKPWTTKVLRGIRAPGTGFPFLIMLGTMRYMSGKDFCVVYKRNPVLVLEFTNERFRRWVIPDNAANREVLKVARPELAIS